MPRINGREIYYWGRREKEVHDTERHKLFREELYPFATEDSKSFALRIAQFMTDHPDLIYF